jgi:hypothetical protein
MQAGHLLTYLRSRGCKVFAVRIADQADRTTWTVEHDADATDTDRAFTATELEAATDTAIADAVLTATALSQSDQKDVLATCALVAKTVDPTGWAALTLAQKVAKVKALAADWRGFRVFVEKNL